MSKFTLGEVIDGLFTGKFIKAKAEVVYDQYKELYLDGDRIFCNTFPGGEVETDIFIPNWNDNNTKWEAEYHINHQPFEVFTVVFDSDRDGLRKTETARFENKCWIEINTKMNDSYYFKGYHSAVGHLENRVVVFRGKVEEA